jgi:hypothetical protein
MSLRSCCVAMVLLGCSPGAADPPPETQSPLPSGATPLPCEVGQALQSKCWNCHGAQTSAGAPMSLTSWESFQKPTRDGTETVAQRMAKRILDHTMPPPLMPGLSDQEQGVLQSWIAQGAPAGTGCQPPPPGGGGSVSQGGAPAGSGGSGGAYYGDTGGTAGQTGSGGSGPIAPPDAGPLTYSPEDVPKEPDPSECDFIEFKARNDATGAKFSVPSGEQYYCFSHHIDVEAGAQALAFYPEIDDHQVIHHWLLYKMATPQANGAVSACLGTHQDGQLLAGWTPGASAWFMPSHVGMELGTGDFILEVHYNNTGAPAQDASGLRVCKAKQHRPDTAGISWLGTEAIFIPPGAQQFAVPSNCKAPFTSPVHILTAWPHMHKLGSSMKANITRASGTVEPLFDVKWNFDYQLQYATPAILQPGDSVQTTCVYDNTTTGFVGFGESTGTEMCYNFIVAYPANTLRVPGLLHSTSCND